MLDLDYAREVISSELGDLFLGYAPSTAVKQSAGNRLGSRTMGNDSSNLSLSLSLAHAGKVSGSSRERRFCDGVPNSWTWPQ